MFNLNYLLIYLAQAVVNEPTGCNENPDCNTPFPQVAANQDTVQIGLQILFGVIGALALIYLIFYGFKLVIAQGEPGEVAKARQAIIYSVVGLVVALSAELIVTFILGELL